MIWRLGAWINENNKHLNWTFTDYSPELAEIKSQPVATEYDNSLGNSGNRNVLIFYSMSESFICFFAPINCFYQFCHICKGFEQGTVDQRFSTSSDSRTSWHILIRIADHHWNCSPIILFSPAKYLDDLFLLISILRLCLVFHIPIYLLYNDFNVNFISSAEFQNNFLMTFFRPCSRTTWQRSADHDRR